MKETIVANRLGYLTVLTNMRRFPMREVMTVDGLVFRPQAPAISLKIICEGGPDEGAYVPDVVLTVSGTPEQLIAQLIAIIESLEVPE